MRNDRKLDGSESGASLAPRAASLLDIPIEMLLDRLDEERKKFSNADDRVVRVLAEELLRRGEYREPIGTPHEVKPFVPLESILRAVWGYGARWHRYREPHRCPHCEADLCDHENGPPFKREIGHVKNDRVAFWQCPECERTIAK